MKFMQMFGKLWRNPDKSWNMHNKALSKLAKVWRWFWRRFIEDFVKFWLKFGEASKGLTYRFGKPLGKLAMVR